MKWSLYKGELAHGRKYFDRGYGWRQLSYGEFTLSTLPTDY